MLHYYSVIHPKFNRYVVALLIVLLFAFGVTFQSTLNEQTDEVAGIRVIHYPVAPTVPVIESSIRI